MPLSPTSAPTDLHELLTNIGVLIAAIGASAAGIWQALRKARKVFEGEPNDKPEERKKVLSAAIIETVSIQQWTEQNHAATEQARQLCLRLDDMLDEMRESRGVSRDFIDEVRKLRLAINDLNDVAKAFKR